MTKESERFVWHEYDMPAKILIASNGSGVMLKVADTANDKEILIPLHAGQLIHTSTTN